MSRVMIPREMLKHLKHYKPTTIVVYVTMVSLLSRGQRKLTPDYIALEAGVTRDDVITALNQLEATGVVITPYVDGNRRNYIRIEPEI